MIILFVREIFRGLALPILLQAQRDIRVSFAGRVRPVRSLVRWIYSILNVQLNFRSSNHRMSFRTHIISSGETTAVELEANLFCFSVNLLYSIQISFQLFKRSSHMISLFRFFKMINSYIVIPPIFCCYIILNHCITQIQFDKPLTTIFHHLSWQEITGHANN